MTKNRHQQIPKNITIQEKKTGFLGYVIVQLLSNLWNEYNFNSKKRTPGINAKKAGGRILPFNSFSLKNTREVEDQNMKY